MAKLSPITIIHGKGTGALRTAIHQMLRKNKAVKSFRLGNFGEGESGVTILMSFFTTDALVLREVRYKEADRILTLFTADRGIITAKARAALRKNSKLSAATQQLTLSDMTVFENKGKCTVQEATVKEPAGLLVVKIALFCFDKYAETGRPLDALNIKAILLAAALLVLTRCVKPLKKLHPVFFILVSAVVGIVFRF